MFAISVSFLAAFHSASKYMPVRTTCSPAPIECDGAFDAYNVADAPAERNRPMANIFIPDGAAIARICSVIADAGQNGVRLRCRDSLAFCLSGELRYLYAWIPVRPIQTHLRRSMHVTIPLCRFEDKYGTMRFSPHLRLYREFGPPPSPPWAG